MRNLKFVLISGLVFGVAVLSQLSRSSAEDGKQKGATLDRMIKVSMKYLIYLPKDYDRQDSWPLMLFLHGAGERGDDLEMVKKHGPPKLIEAGKEFPFIVVSPQCPEDGWWQPIEIKALLDEIVEKYKVDQDRVYLTGLSMGGFGTWAQAAYEPHRFAALAPICGAGQPLTTKRYAKTPVWAFHGGKDIVVPIDSSIKMIESLKKNGGDPKFTVYPDAGHDSWIEAYNDPELYEWLLKQKRKGESAKP
jgi:predicted peptidase